MRKARPTFLRAFWLWETSSTVSLFRPRGSIEGRPCPVLLQNRIGDEGWGSKKKKNSSAQEKKSEEPFPIHIAFQAKRMTSE